MDPRRLAEWVTTHRSLSEGAPTTLARGSTFRQTLSLSGARFDVTWTVVRAERPQRVEWDGEGPAGSSARVRYELEPAGEGATLFRYRNEFELPGGPLGRVAGRAIGSAPARRDAERSLANLKRLVESA